MVTDENVGELLIEGLEEAAAHQRGERPWLKRVRRFAPPPLDERLGDSPGDAWMTIRTLRRTITRRAIACGFD